MGPEKVPICPEKARFRRKDFPPIFSENLGLKPPFVSPPLDFPKFFLYRAIGRGVFGSQIQKPGDHPDFRKNALGVKRPFSELSESSGVFSEQLSELEIPFLEYEIPFSEWPLAT